MNVRERLFGSSNSEASTLSELQLSIDRSNLVDIENEFLDEIEAFDTQSNERSLGIDTGFPKLNEALNGLEAGLIMVSGPANTGKTAFCLQLAWQIANLNRDSTPEHPFRVYVLYFSLDDATRDVIPRFVAIEEHMDIRIVKTPHRHAHSISDLIRRATGIRKLKQSLNVIKVVDKGKGCSIEYITGEVERHMFDLQNMESRDNVRYKLVVFIDNFHDIEVESQRYNDENRRYNDICAALDTLAIRFDLPIICTAELRKLNGLRRPTNDDIRETVKMSYKAKAILSCYNEVGIRDQNASIYWTHPERQEKMPVLEVRFTKNKMSSYKGRLFFKFIPEQSRLIEADTMEAQRYAQASQ